MTEKMRKILWVDLYRQEGKKILVVLAVFLVGADLLVGILDNPLIEIGMNAYLISFFNLKNMKVGWRKIPEGIFMTPTNFTDRKNYIRARIFLEWIVEGVLYSGIALYLMITWKENGIDSLMTKEGILSFGVIAVQILALIHFMIYDQYFEETGIWYTELFGLALIGKMILIIMGVFIRDYFFTVYAMLYFLFVLPFLYLDYKTARVHFANMICFYADYEHSRGIKKIQP